MNPRTFANFNYAGDIFAVVEPWAAENGYKLKSSTPAKREYQKGTGFLVAPMMLSIERAGESTRLEAWVRMNLFVRAMSLFILPAEMGIESGGFRAVLPRNIARGAVNGLLARLQLPLIS